MRNSHDERPNGALFLNADVEEEVFVKTPPRYEYSNKAGVLLGMKLKKSLYELYQSLKNWFGTMNQCLGDIGVCPLKLTRAVYIYEDEVRDSDDLR